MPDSPINPARRLNCDPEEFGLTPLQYRHLTNVSTTLESILLFLIGGAWIALVTAWIQPKDAWKWIAVVFATLPMFGFAPVLLIMAHPPLELLLGVFWPAFRRYLRYREATGQ